MDDAILRQALDDLLTRDQAHAGARAAFRRLRPENRSARPRPGGHSVWELLEHLRISQEDIVRYTLDASWTSPEWPGGYWPEPGRSPTEKEWTASLDGF